MSKLIRQTERIYYLPCEDKRDRPLLGYIKGDRFSVAVDAGHSENHVKEFYEELRKEGLPLPEITVLTHWHWDHTFGMHAVHGITIAGRKTNDHLKEIEVRMDEGEALRYRAMDPHIDAEYAEGQEMKVVQADAVFEGEMELNPGGLTVRLIHTPSPHTEDSVLIYVPEEKALFLGDCTSGEYPEWIVDQERMQKLIDVLEPIPFIHALTGHWEEDNKKDLLARLREDGDL